MQQVRILWVDDEIELLKSHIIFLENRNYSVTSCISGYEALEIIEDQPFDIVLLDENMPGLSGLETLSQLKTIKSNLPVIMITKSEEEYIMDEAIGSKIADYLIKPVNPNQILLSLKKSLDHSRLITEKTTSGYQQEFRNISIELATVNSFEAWNKLYQKLIRWELELESIEDSGLTEILKSQKQEANSQFFKFITKNYASWFISKDAPTLSPSIFKKYVLPSIKTHENTLFVIIDNLRYDQWRLFEPLIQNHYRVIQEIAYCSILPSATQYARNAIFSGLMPLEMASKYPDYWRDDIDAGGKNLFEKEFLKEQLIRLGMDIPFDYFKITNLQKGKELLANFANTKQNKLCVAVFNFVDMLSHARTEMDMIKELTADDKAYRSLSLSWFKNSTLFELIQKAQQLKYKLIITTDHGTINVKNPSKVIGDKQISSNLRYKTGRSLTYNDKEVYAVTDPKQIHLPSLHMSSSYIFAKEDYFFAYPNNYNHFVKYYKNTFQHGGISLEEMIIPCIILDPK